MDTKTLARERLSRKIAGEIVLSHDAGKTIQKWRNIFKIPQRKLADEIGIMPSVISDYENGRRKSPGIKVIKRLVNAMISLDEKSGGKIIQDFSAFPTKTVLSDGILDMKEFKTPISIKDFCKIIESPVIVRSDLINNKLYGYTIIDSMKAIIELSPMDMVKLYGLTSERALIFTGAHRGKSSMVALKVTNLRPGLVVLHGSEGIDDLARRIAELESIPVGITKIKNVDQLIKTLKRKTN
ncbi:MAG: helix-turn-helix domain-containing protein [Candidatus Aenigmatarchaeota archaeon]